MAAISQQSNVGHLGSGDGLLFTERQCVDYIMQISAYDRYYTMGKRSYFLTFLTREEANEKQCTDKSLKIKRCCKLVIVNISRVYFNLFLLQLQTNQFKSINVFFISSPEVKGEVKLYDKPDSELSQCLLIRFGQVVRAAQCPSCPVYVQILTGQ